MVFQAQGANFWNTKTSYEIAMCARATRLGFTLFDWPLRTRDPAAANDAALYIYSAAIALETLAFTSMSYKKKRFASTWTQALSIG